MKPNFISELNEITSYLGLTNCTSKRQKNNGTIVFWDSQTDSLYKLTSSGRVYKTNRHRCQYMLNPRFHFKKSMIAIRKKKTKYMYLILQNDGMIGIMLRAVARSRK